MKGVYHIIKLTLFIILGFQMSLMRRLNDKDISPLESGNDTTTDTRVCIHTVNM